MSTKGPNAKTTKETLKMQLSKIIADNIALLRQKKEYPAKHLDTFLNDNQAFMVLTKFTEALKKADAMKAAVAPAPAPVKPAFDLLDRMPHVVDLLDAEPEKVIEITDKAVAVFTLTGLSRGK